jgi:predicted nuclease of predicted toxin-antitoxin system
MKVWLDAHLSPQLAPWIEAQFECECKCFRELGFQSSADRTVFLAARLVEAIIISKDSDFADLQRLLGPPPKVIWLRCGIRPNQKMRELLDATFPSALKLLEVDDLVKIKES